MRHLKQSLDAKGHCMLEMPSGTGKTVTLLSLIVAYQQVHRDRCRLIYCSRTVPEMDKALAELKRLIKYREDQTGQTLKFLGLGLTSRRNLCINPSVNKHKVGRIVDARCHALTASHVRAKAQSAPSVPLCEYFEEIERAGTGLALASGVYTLDDLVSYGRQNRLCPYFAARRFIQSANVVIFSYHYLLDPKIAQIVSREMSKESVVVFDEAHNIDNVCIESMSVDLNRAILDNGMRGCARLGEEITRLKSRDAEKLKHEYQSLVEGLQRTGAQRISDEILANPILPDDVLNEAVPGSVRRAEHFVSLLRRLVEYLKTRLKALYVISETPATFMQQLKNATLIDRKPLRFCSERLSSLMHTLELVNIDEYSALGRIAEFATLVSTYATGYMLIIEPFDSQAPNVANPVLHLSCLDASLALGPILKRFQTVIITSGTLSPLEMYPRMLKFSPAVMQSLTMSLARDCFSPLVVTRGNDQVSISSKFEVRSSPAVVRNYGLLLLEMARTVPDGLACFFPSYIYMEQIISSWNESGLLAQVLQHKLIFIETPDSVETSISLDNYRAACDNGRGAVLLSVARGKVSEGIDFDHHYGRAVIMFGIPYQYTESRVLRARLEYLREEFQIREEDFLAFDALRHAAQCIGRVLRGKSDYGLMILADARYARLDKRSKLPLWISSAISEANANLSTDMAVHIAKMFYKQMAQPFQIQNQIGQSLWALEDIDRYEQKQRMISESQRM